MIPTENEKVYAIAVLVGGKNKCIGYWRGSKNRIHSKAKEIIEKEEGKIAFDIIEFKK